MRSDCYIGGAFVRGDAAPVVVTNPANDAVLAEIPGVSFALAAKATEANVAAARAMRGLRS